LAKSLVTVQVIVLKICLKNMKVFIQNAFSK